MTSPATSLELCGFSAARGCFLLAPAHSDCSRANQSLCAPCATTSHLLAREFVDLQSWDRLLRRASTCQRLPTKRLRKLMATDWRRGDGAAGWQREMQKNVRACEDWLNAAFRQLPMRQQHEFLDDELYAAMKRQRAAALADSKRARNLQQYFSSAEMVQLVVASVLEYVAVRAVAWLEPSCGDGRFLTALLRAGAQHVVGYEIDQRLQSLAERNVQRAAVDVAGISMTCSGEDNFVVAIGNPPFGARGESRNDLVHDFFRHAASAWRARVIAFIVPERCSRPLFVEQTLQKLNSERVDSNAATALSCWILAMELPLTDYEFEFGAHDVPERVRQPSLLQLFTCAR